MRVDRAAVGSMPYIAFFSLSLAFTLVVELLTLLALTRRLTKIRISFGDVIFWGTCANLLTLPYLWFVFPLFLPSATFVWIGEMIVVVVEAIVYWQAWKISARTAIALSLVANLFSYVGGLVWHWFAF